MHGISAVAGTVKHTWSSGGKEYLLKTPKLRDFGEKEDYILRLRSKRGYVSDQSKNTAHHVTFEEENAFNSSTRGVLYRLWASLKMTYEEYDVDEEDGIKMAADLLEEATEERGRKAFVELMFVLNQIEQGDLLKNSDGLGDSQAKAQESSITQNTESPGPDSMSQS